MTRGFRRRLKRLEPRPNPPPMAIVLACEGETREEAMQKHLERNPDADFSGLVIFVEPLVPPPGYFDRLIRAGAIRARVDSQGGPFRDGKPTRPPLDRV